MMYIIYIFMIGNGSAASTFRTLLDSLRKNKGRPSIVIIDDADELICSRNESLITDSLYADDSYGNTTVNTPKPYRKGVCNLTSACSSPTNDEVTHNPYNKSQNNSFSPKVSTNSRSVVHSCFYTLLEAIRHSSTGFSVIISTSLPISSIDTALLDRLVYRLISESICGYYTL